MLTTDQRELFLDALRPPEGYRFDRGIGTTFTLNLLTLLIAPLSLALLEVSDATEALHDPVLLLEGLRRYADRLTIFCQAGRIAVPPPDNYLYSFLEKSVIQVQAPRRERNGSFHPKVWLLRYESETDGAPLYRFLNLSRNLTFDKSWDLILRLEGLVARERAYAYSRNNPLGDFIQWLPQLACHPVEERIAQDIALLEQEVRRVAFEVPWPFMQDSLTFYPFGIPGYYHRDSVFEENYWQALVLAPFLDDRQLQHITNVGEGHVLISRADSIAALKPETLARFGEIYVLDEMGVAEPEPESDTDESVGEEASVPHDPAGLHAKLFVTESGWDATWLLGSANATSAAFRNRNVEFMVKLQGRRSKIGIDKILGEEEDDNALLSLLREYRPESQAEVDEGEKQAEQLAGSIRDWLIDLEMQLEVSQQGEDAFDLSLRFGQASAQAPEGNYTITCWPVTLREGQRAPFDYAPHSAVIFPRLSLLALTPFIAFDVKAQAEDHKHTTSFVLSLPISGIPQNRKDYLYSAIISDQTQFLRYLWLLLSEDESGMLDWMQSTTEKPGASWRAGWGNAGFPLLEPLVRALSRAPDKIDRIAELIEGLQRTPQGQQVLPEGFEQLWEAIVQIRNELE